jgi:capsular exopolysaccharide synthesis family protein
MSQIFDALQRSEAERSGVVLSPLSGATELLQRAELQAASKWEAALLASNPDAKEGPERETSLDLQRVSSVPAAPEALAAGKQPQAGEHREIFGEIQSLQVSLPKEHRLVCLSDGGSPAGEAYRLLGVRLQHLRRDRSLKKVLITSTIPQEGKSTVAANLACTLASRTGQRILLLEGDLRRPSLSQMFGLGRNPGICEQLQGERSLTASIYYLEGAGLWFWPAGTAPNNPLELLQSGRLSTLMDQLNEWFDWIIIDSPPVLPLADTSVWMRLADGVLLITRQGTTEKRQLMRGLEAIETKKLIGALLNGSKTLPNSYYYYGPAATSRRGDASVSNVTET